MSDKPELSAEDIENLNKLLDLNASRSTQKLTDLAASWGLGGVHSELAELLGGLREADRPASAVSLSQAIAGYLEEFGPRGVVGTADTYRDHRLTGCRPMVRRLVHQGGQIGHISTVDHQSMADRVTDAGVHDRPAGGAAR